MILLRDITDVLDDEERSRRQERLAGVGRLAAGVAHEIRNPIASISGAAQLLESFTGDESERTRLTSLIVRESERVDRLVSSLLRFSRPPQTNRDVVRVDEIILRCIESVRARPEFEGLAVEIVTDIHGTLELPASRDELAEVVNNLLVNSMQAFRRPGDRQGRRRISVSAPRRDARRSSSSSPTTGPESRRSTRAGSSIRFSPLSRPAPELGLGAEVHKIVRDHNGQVDLDSEEGPRHVSDHPVAGTDRVSNTPR